MMGRKDTRGVLDWYIKQAYQLVKTKQQRMGNATPLQDIEVMKEFWVQYHDGQDTMMLCLEIQQRYLYEDRRAKFLARISEIDKWFEKLEEAKMVDGPLKLLRTQFQEASKTLIVG